MSNRPQLLSATALAVFRLNGQVLELAELLAAPSGLTAAHWQVLGAVLPAPLPVSGIARVMGITRQSVQRIADLLVDRGMARYADNPAHRRARLLVPSERGRAAIARIGPGHAAAAEQLAELLGDREWAAAVQHLERLSDALTALARQGAAEPASAS